MCIPGQDILLLRLWYECMRALCVEMMITVKPACRWHSAHCWHCWCQADSIHYTTESFAVAGAHYMACGVT